MTLAEFKAWFEGYTEDMDKAPTEKQWKRIKKRVAEIDGTPITREVWVERYRPWYYPSITAFGSSSTTTTIPSTDTIIMNANLASQFDNAQSMFALGKSEAASGDAIG